MKYSDLQNLLKAAFPQTDHEADAGYILRDGTIIDISDTWPTYCHGKEFFVIPSLMDWRNQHPELPPSQRLMVDAVSQGIGAIQFTIDNCHLQCVRLPNNPLTAEQRQPLSEIIGRILERGKIRVEILGTREYAEYEANVSTTEQVMSKIDSYYSTGSLPA